MRTKNSTVPAYIAAAPKASRPMLRQLRQVIRAVAPKAEEKISYGMPYYAFHGRLVYFAGYQHYCGLYMLPTTSTALVRALSAYRTSKATVRFPIDQPLPVALVKKVVQARVKENLSRARLMR